MTYRLKTTGATKVLQFGFSVAFFAIALSHPPRLQAQDEPAVDRAIDEIVVTARKREENVQEVPITIDLIDGDYLNRQSVTTLDYLQFTLPGVSIEPFENAARISIRGVGSASSGLGAEDSAAVHQDGVYLGFPGQALGRMFDVERLEILKGPQGTLYGRNATAGVLNIISRRPGDEFSLDADITVGSFETVRSNVAADLPISDRGGMRIAATFGESEGYLENGFGGSNLNSEEFFGLRGLIDVEINDRLSMQFTAQLINDDSQAPNALAVPPESPDYLGYNVARIDDPVISEQRDTTLALQFDLDLGDVTYRSLTGYADHEAFNDFDCDPAGLPIEENLFFFGCRLFFDEDHEQFSQELQAIWTSPTGDTDAVFGFYYLTTDGGEQRIIDTVTFPELINSTDTADGTAYGIFGELNHLMRDNLRLNLGLRYNTEDREATTFGAGLFDFPGFIGDEDDYDNISGRLGLDYFVSDSALLYFGASRGFKAGGLLPVALTGDAGDGLDSFDEETLWAYELGYKRDLPGDTGVLNLSGYFYDYSDIQIETARFDETAIVFEVDNATSATIWGFDATYEGNLTEIFGVDLSVSYINSEFDDFLTLDGTGNTIDYTGNTLPRAPEWSFTGGLNLVNVDVANGVRLSARAEYSYRSRIYFAADNLVDQDSLSFLNANVQLDFADGRYFVRVTGRNLTDEEYVTFNNGAALAKHGRPRELFGTFGVNF